MELGIVSYNLVRSGENIRLTRPLLSLELFKKVLILFPPTLSYIIHMRVAM